MNILYYGGGWPTNIGNAFIDLGAMGLLHAAAPSARVGFASELPRWLFGRGYRASWNIGRPHTRSAADARAKTALDVAAISDCDVVVIAGMAMCEEFVAVNGPPMLALAKRGVPLLLLGTGASLYSGAEQRTFANFLRRLNVVGFISRDDDSFDMFAPGVVRTLRGVDCGFFLPEAYTPLRVVLQSYVVLAFDGVNEPPIDTQSRLVIRAHHECLGGISKKYLKEQHTLISDIPHDYITIYAGADEVHSDRVHACVAALAYGGKAKLYSNTKRKALFSAVGVGHVSETLTGLDMEGVLRKKHEQMAFLKDVMSNLK